MKLIFSVVTNGQWLQVVVDRISQSITRLKEINTSPLKVNNFSYYSLFTALKILTVFTGDHRWVP